MNKKGVTKIIVALLFVAAAVLWLLSVLLPDAFAGWNLAWIISVFGGSLGLIFILKGLFSKKALGIKKKFDVILGGVLMLGAVLALVGTIISDKLVLPIIAVAVTLIALLCLLAVGGKKWDTADNEKVGYKNYYERKKEQEKK